jgi:predicted ATPase/DNA-binding SARP family transcriptional activator
VPATAHESALRVRTLGAFAVWRGTVPMAVPIPAQGKAAALFKCLLGAPDHRLHAEALTDLLWPDAAAADGAGKLRQTMYHLRRALGTDHTGADYVQRHGDLLVLVPAPGARPPADWLDVAAFEQAAARALAETGAAACRAALALYGGEYLPEDRYEDWAATRREELRQQHLAVLLHLAEIREREGGLGEAARCLRAILAIDPFHESAARGLMRIHAATGRYAEAARTYRLVSEALQQELALPVSAETNAQYQAVLAAAKTARTTHTNLPTPLTSFLGRESEMTAATRLLCEAAPGRSPTCRLLTLTGAGGCGKTRLGTELGHEIRHRFAGGVWLVELAPLAPSAAADPIAIARQACDALALPREPGRSALETCVAGLASRRLLLILDNCEHVIPACAAFAATVLRRCPGVQILATSREALGVLGETVWPVVPLAVPSRRTGESLTPRELGRYAGVSLFVERARAARPSFALTVDTSSAVVEICRRLDGLPLAIELAAARLAQLSIEAVAARLHDRFRLLTAGNRAALPRHQTLRAVLDWSYALLSAPEQALLRALSVFAGSWSLEAAEALDAGPWLAAGDLLDLHTRLVSKSLIEMEDGGNLEVGARYRLLESVRQYAGEHLKLCGEEAALRDRHRDWFLALATAAAAALRGPDQRTWLARLDAEHDNLRSALAWCAREDGDVALGLRLASALWHFWQRRGHWQEGSTWLSLFLDREGSAPSERVPALHALGWLAEDQGDIERARAAAAEMLVLARNLNDPDGIANALNHVVSLDTRQGEYTIGAVAHYEEVLSIRRAQGDRAGIAAALHNLGRIAMYRGDLQRAVALLDESLAFRAAVGDRYEYAWTLVVLAEAVYFAGDPSRAATLVGELYALCAELDEDWGLAAACYLRGRLAHDRGAVVEALDDFRRCMTLFRTLGYQSGLADVFECWAACAVACDDFLHAARFLGAAHGLRGSIGESLAPYAVDAHERTLQRVRDGLDEQGFARAWSAGAALSPDAAVADALAWQPNGGAR